MYKPFVATNGLCFAKSTNRVLPRMPPDGFSTETSAEGQVGIPPLRILRNISGFSSVFMPGMSAGFVLKTSASLPHLMRMRGAPIQCLDAFNSPSGNGFIFLDSEVRDVH